MGGGYETGRLGSYRIDCYNPVNNTWSSPINTPCCYFALTALNNNLLVVGGLDKVYTSSCQIFTIDPGQTQLKNYTEMITARSLATVAGYQGILIIAGGKSNGKILCSTEIFDSGNREWYTTKDLPQPHYWLQSVIVDNMVYLLGGFSKDYVNSSTVFAASLDTVLKHQLNWSAFQDTPWCCSAPVSVHGTHLLIVGGSKKFESQATSDVYKLDKVNQRWEAIGHIPSVRKSSAAVSTADDRVIVIGGLNHKRKFVNTVWIGNLQ